MSAMDGSIVNVSLLTIANNFNTNMEGIRWIVIIYLLTISSFIGICGSLGDNHGRKLIFQIGMFFFMFGSLTSAFSPTAMRSPSSLTIPSEMPGTAARSATSEKGPCSRR